MASPGYSTGIYRSGTSTGMTAEACSLVTGKTYRVTNAARRLLDPAVAVVVDDNGSPVAAGDIASIDYLHGVVTFDAGYTVTGPVTIDANYLPISQVADAFSYATTTSVGMLDKTKFGDTVRTRLPGLGDVSGSIDLKTSSGADAIAALAAAGTIAYLVIQPAGTGSAEHLRARVLFESVDGSAALDGVVQTSYSFTGDSLLSQEGREVRSFSWNY